jgi:hypothetical protein
MPLAKAQDREGLEWLGARLRQAHAELIATDDQAIT